MKKISLRNIEPMLLRSGISRKTALEASSMLENNFLVRDSGFVKPVEVLTVVATISGVDYNILKQYYKKIYPDMFANELVKTYYKDNK